MRWANAHDDARITSMAFDLNFRRLITGCENGGVKVQCSLSVQCSQSQNAAAGDCASAPFQRTALGSSGPASLYVL